MKKYINVQKFNDGIAVQGQVPIDDRLVFTSRKDLYISEETKSADPLYSLAYDGMQVAVLTEGDEAEVIVLKDATYYTPGKVLTINESNFDQYWTVVGKTTVDYINNVIDPSLNAVHNYINSTNVLDQSNAGAVQVTTKLNANGIGNTYGLTVKTDDDTIKLVSDKVTGTKYQFAVASTTSGYLKSYKLQYLAPGSSVWQDVSGSLIDIPKDNVLKEVHICKASKSVNTKDGSIVYTESSKNTDAAWETDENPVYVHFIWETFDLDKTTGKTSESFLKVSDIIDDDLTGIRADIKRIDSSIDRLDESLDSSVKRIDSSIKEAVARIDASLGEINDSIDRLDSSLVSVIDKVDTGEMYYNPGSHKDSEVVYSKHGNLNSGITVGELKTMTISDILSKILLETITPTKSTDMGASIALTGYSSVQEVGSSIPTSSNFTTSFQSEIWKSTASDGTEVASYILSKKDKVVVYYNSSNSTTGGSNIATAAYTALNRGVGEAKIAELPYYYYAEVSYTGNEDATDSAGKVIQAKKEGMKPTTVISVVGQWKMYSNASKVSTSDLWSSRNTNPGVYSGIDASVDSGYLMPLTKTVYMQWPNNTTAAQKFYIYVPDAVKIVSSGKANDNIANDYASIALPYTLVDTVEHTNAKGITGTFKKYEIAKTGGITTGKFVFAAE